MLDYAFLLAVHLAVPSASQIVLGPNGQDCTPGIGDDPNNCPISADGNFTSLMSQSVLCSDNFDCCTCASITCGTFVNSQYCTGFKSQGTKAAFFVFPVSIIGNPTTGTPILCNGVSSCEGSQIDGRWISSIDCVTTRACADVSWQISCLLNPGCTLTCRGEGSCKGLFEVFNTAKLDCGADACADGVFDLRSDANISESIVCNGTRACHSAEISMNHVSTISCLDDYACAEAIIVITDPTAQFVLECDGFQACDGLSILVNVTDLSPSNVQSGFQCTAQQSCRNLDALIINQSPAAVTVDSLSCSGNLACAGSTFEVQEVTNLITFLTCDCGDGDGCVGATQIGSGTPIGCIPFATTSTTYRPTPLILPTPRPTSPRTTTTSIITMKPTPILTTTSKPSKPKTPSPIYIPPPTIHVPPPTIHVPPPTIFIPPPTIHIPPPSIHIPPFTPTKHPSIHIPQIIGPDGQDCTHGDDDNPPNACPLTAISTFTSLSSDDIQCKENFDCCLCSSISCGTPSLISPSYCKGIIFNGDSAAFGVQRISVLGNPRIATPIDCNGDSSCAYTSLQGTNIDRIKCTGDSSCSNAHWSVTCPFDSPCKLECAGDLSCQSAHFIVSHSLGLSCSHDSCLNARFALDSNLGEDVECDAERACFGATIRINNVRLIKCSAELSCAHAEFYVTNVQEGFHIECSGVRSCQGMYFELLMTDGSEVDAIDGVRCVGESACDGATFSMVNQMLGRDLVVRELDCNAVAGCQDASFELLGSGVGVVGGGDSLGGKVLFQRCLCGNNGCVGTHGIEQCFENLDRLECQQFACLGQSATIVNPKKDFELVCNDVASCNNFELVVVLNGEGVGGVVENLKGVRCGNSLACAGLVVRVRNEQKGVVVKVKSVECVGQDACVGAVFGGGLIGNVAWEEVQCDGNCGAEGAGIGVECMAERDGAFTYCGSASFH